MTKTPSQAPLEKGWQAVLGAEFKKDYMNSLHQFLQNEATAQKIIYPASKNIFAAFNLTPFDQVKVVIIGQDPYHGEGQAHGLAFSVRPEVPIPPSLKNIFLELSSDCKIPLPNHGHLTSWASQGVLLLNTVLTVEKGKAGSHHNKGWEQFTDKVVEVLNHQEEHLVFLLWGSPAQKKGSIVNPQKHLVLKSVHPSPLSAYRGFFGSHHFSQTNRYLIQQGKSPIDWQLPHYGRAAI